MIKQKKLWLLTLGLLLLLGLTAPGAALAAVSPYLEGGIGYDLDYREMNFLTGRPVLLSGTAKVSATPARNGVAQTRLTYTLTGQEGAVKLTRSLTLKTNQEEKPGGQLVEVTTVERYSESVTAGKDRFSLTDYQFSRSVLTDRRAAVDYFSGNWGGRKTYTINKDGRAVVEYWGNTVGYDQHWGKTETQEMQGTVTFDGNITVNKAVYPQQWQGTFRMQVSNNDFYEFSYEENGSLPISFSGGFLETSQSAATLSHSYDLPRLDANGLLAGNGRNNGSDVAAVTTMPEQRRLPVPAFRDLAGHWAERGVLRLYGLEALREQGEYFGPNLPMTRGQFAAALVRLVGIQTESPAATVPARPQPAGLAGRTRVQQPPPPQNSIFADVPINHPDYPALKAAFERGIMQGTAPGLFSPNDPLTRAQALTVLVRTLGLAGLAAGDAKVSSGFTDAAAVPAWAREAVLVASRLGLARGDEYGFLHPNDNLSRAEGAALLDRLLDFLRDDLRREYREGILNYR